MMHSGRDRASCVLEDTEKEWLRSIWTWIIVRGEMKMEGGA